MLSTAAPTTRPGASPRPRPACPWFAPPHLATPYGTPPPSHPPLCRTGLSYPLPQHLHAYSPGGPLTGPVCPAKTTKRKEGRTCTAPPPWRTQPSLTFRGQSNRPLCAPGIWLPSPVHLSPGQDGGRAVLVAGRSIRRRVAGQVYIICLLLTKPFVANLPVTLLLPPTWFLHAVLPFGGSACADIQMTPLRQLMRTVPLAPVGHDKTTGANGGRSRQL